MGVHWFYVSSLHYTRQFVIFWAYGQVCSSSFAILILVKSSAFWKRLVSFMGDLFKIAFAWRWRAGRCLWIQISWRIHYKLTNNWQSVIGLVAMPLDITCFCRFQLIVQQLKTDWQWRRNIPIFTIWSGPDPFRLQFKIAENKE